MSRIRYFGGGFGRMPSVRRRYLLKKPRGFSRPDSSVSRACSVPSKDELPPPMALPAMKRSTARPIRVQRVSGSSGAGGAESRLTAARVWPER